MYYMFDDHEIVDNYRLSKGTTNMYVNAVLAWKEYTKRSNTDPMVEDGSHYTFRTAGVFFLDTRSYRCPLDVCGEEDRMR